MDISPLRDAAKVLTHDQYLTAAAMRTAAGK
jgi:hypothetical protein